MGFETRRNGRYFYEKIRIGNRVVSRYIGSGLRATIAEERVAGNALDCTEQALERTQQHIAQRDVCQLLVEVEQIAHIVLLCAGYHPHKSQWRKRRTMTRRTKQPVDGLPPRPAAGDTSPEAFKALMIRCKTALALPEDIAALRAIAPHFPGLAEKGDMLNRALVRAYSDQIKGDAPYMAVAYESAIAKRRADLGYATAPALERPLIDALILAEQRLGFAESLYGISTTASAATLNVVEQRLDGAHRRYLRLVEALARIRRVRVEAYASDGTRSVGVAVEQPGM